MVSRLCCTPRQAPFAKGSVAANHCTNSRAKRGIFIKHLEKRNALHQTEPLSHNGCSAQNKAQLPSAGTIAACHELEAAHPSKAHASEAADGLGHMYPFRPVQLKTWGSQRQACEPQSLKPLGLGWALRCRIARNTSRQSLNLGLGLKHHTTI